jgi:hypothetical protein
MALLAGARLLLNFLLLLRGDVPVAPNQRRRIQYFTYAVFAAKVASHPTIRLYGAQYVAEYGARISPLLLITFPAAHGISAQSQIGFNRLFGLVFLDVREWLAPCRVFSPL